MVIAHVIDSLDVGGAEAVVASLCRLQAAAGHSPEVHCLVGKGAIGDMLEAEGIPVRVHGARRTLATMWSVYGAFRRSTPDVVHCHNKRATVLAAAAARLNGCGAVISTRHGMAALPYRLRKELKFWVTAAFFCDRVVAVCETARRNMIVGAKGVAHKVVTIRNGAHRASATDATAPRKEGFTLITVGRLAPAKNYGTLLRSVALARRDVPDLALWMLGDGAEADSLRRLAGELGISDAVRFWGEQSDVGCWLQRADLFVMSSISEGLPISILEAMAAGLPAIVTDVGGMPEVIQMSESGTIVGAGDAEALAAAIVDYAARRDQLVTLGRRAANCYERHFTPQRMTADYQALYERCLRHRAAAT
jgi:glycosyltransferase involved in cell wall biosynthesis